MSLPLTDRPDTAGGADDGTEALLARIALCTGLKERRRLEQEVVIRNLDLAARIASGYRGRGVDWDDLLQVARLGLLKAVCGFRAGRGAGFCAYAAPTIAGEIKRHFRDCGWVIRPPRRLQELSMQVSTAEPSLRQELQRTPTYAELAGALSVPERELEQALLAAGGYHCLSLDAPTSCDNSSPLAETFPDRSDAFDLVDTLQCLRPALVQLTERERQIIHLRFVDCRTQEQIGTTLGLSQMQVSRLLTSILAHLRQQLVATEEAC